MWAKHRQQLNVQKREHCRQPLAACDGLSDIGDGDSIFGATVEEIIRLLIPSSSSLLLLLICTTSSPEAASASIGIYCDERTIFVLARGGYAAAPAAGDAYACPRLPRHGHLGGCEGAMREKGALTAHVCCSDVRSQPSYGLRGEGLGRRRKCSSTSSDAAGHRQRLGSAAALRGPK